MGSIIQATADMARIEEHVRITLRKALARGEPISSVAQNRLGPAVAAIEAAYSADRDAHEKEATAWAAVLGADARGDLAIANIRDDMWHALGRPRQSPYLDAVFPDGVKMYTGGDPRSQPTMMHLLSSRILAGTAPQWTAELKKEWADAIEALRQPLLDAVEAHRPLEAASTIARATYLAAVRAGHNGLRQFKRELLILGLDEAQVHEIIPDASLGTSGGPPQPKPSVPPANLSKAA